MNAQSVSFKLIFAKLYYPCAVVTMLSELLAGKSIKKPNKIDILKNFSDPCAVVTMLSEVLAKGLMVRRSSHDRTDRQL